MADTDAPVDSENVRRSITRVAAAAMKKTGFSGDRRLFVQSWVRALQSARGGDMGELTSDDADVLVTGASVELEAAERAAAATEGE